MKQQHIDILEDAQRWFDSIDDIDKFLDDMFEYQKNASGPTIDEFLGRNMQIYSVGEFCQHEGGGWSLLVADNENAFENIKKVLIEHHEEERQRYLDFADDEDSDNFNWDKDIQGHTEIIELVRNATCIEDINNKEIPPWNHDVIRIRKETIIS